MSTITTEHPHATLVRRGYEAFNTGDIGALTKLFDDTASWHTPGRSTIAGEHEGREATCAQFGRYAGETTTTLKARLVRVLTDDDGGVLGVRQFAERCRTVRVVHDGDAITVKGSALEEVDQGQRDAHRIPSFSRAAVTNGRAADGWHRGRPRRVLTDTPHPSPRRATHPPLAARSG
jgi:ketosteroid isomerase-like protein